MKIKCIRTKEGIGKSYVVPISHIESIDFADTQTITIRTDNGKHYWISYETFTKLLNEMEVI